MKTLTGIVLSTKMTKTAVVKVESQWRHPVYQKTVKRSKKYLVDNPEGKAHEGETITIREVGPISKRKNWVIVEIKA